jgi:hypothetical protein
MVRRAVTNASPGNGPQVSPARFGELVEMDFACAHCQAFFAVPFQWIDGVWVEHDVLAGIDCPSCCQDALAIAGTERAAAAPPV